MTGSNWSESACSVKLTGARLIPKQSRSMIFHDKASPNWKRELLAGVTTFASMAYILVVNPDMLAITGMDHAALVTATALAATIGTLLMAILTNYPIALAPGMGLNAFFTFTLCGQLEIPWQGALAMVFWTGVLFLVLSLTRFREEVLRAIPPALRIGIQAGIGLFIVTIGLKNLGLIGDPQPGWIALRVQATPSLIPVLLAGIGLGVALLLIRLKIAGALLISIILITIAGSWVSVGGEALTPKPETLFALPPSLEPIGMEVDWLYPFRHWETVWIAFATLLFVDLFDSIGTLIGVGRLAGLEDEKGELPRIRQALSADAAASAIGACVGSSTTTAYIESATGVRAGGKTGWTGITVAACFLIALFFYPLIAVAPSAAVVPALLIVGGLMMRSLIDLKAEDWQSKAGAFAIVIAIPLQFQIAEGIATGLVIYTVLMILSRRAKELHWILLTLSLLFAIHLAFAK